MIMKPQKTYRIEMWSECLNKWMTYHVWFSAMTQGYAFGAWDMVCCFNGGGRSFRLVRNGDDTIIKTHETGRIKVN